MKNILLPLLSIFFSCSDQGVKIEKKHPHNKLMLMKF